MRCCGSWLTRSSPSSRDDAMRLVGRLIIVPIALAFGALAAAGVLLTLGHERMIIATRGASADVLVNGMELVLKIGVVMLSPVTLAVPFLIAVAGEVARIRAAAYYVAAFGAAAALIPLIGRIDIGGAGSVPIWAVFATSGFAAGFVYWLIAGRSA
jgi:hypothetical protein